MNDVLDMFFIKTRTVPRIINERLHKHYIAKLCNRYGWSEKLCKVVLKAYYEFMELKIVTRDWYTITVLPSWAVDQVWRLMALETDSYEYRCKKLCSHVIHYHSDIDFSSDKKLKLIQQTKDIYNARFGLPLKGGVWNFNFTNHWWDEYDRDIKCSQVGFYINGLLKRWVCIRCMIVKKEKALITKSEQNANKLNGKCENLSDKNKSSKNGENNQSLLKCDLNNIQDGVNSCIKSEETVKINNTDAQNPSLSLQVATTASPSTEPPDVSEQVIVKTPEVTSECIINTPKAKKRNLKRLSLLSEPYNIVTRSAKKKRLT